MANTITPGAVEPEGSADVDIEDVVKRIIASAGQRARRIKRRRAAEQRRNIDELNPADLAKLVVDRW
ncbi:hypothetical protein C3Y87_09830 [Carbonactinospora thermoautotrophica]|uniref:hypothetical protein n=1 Tax=Carbonactinospora thermoautotrophica TaxID=1469144 RepID=UPI00226D728C|nr:hypothetical protein [Carbonactinospora thermoautotrophica]MCX9191708.1 hypothetical protein [Carbonactinospora thermoautotrophica]